MDQKIHWTEQNIVNLRLEFNQMDAKIGQMQFDIKNFETEIVKIKHEAVLQSEYSDKISKLSKLVNKALYWVEDVFSN